MTRRYAGSHGDLDAFMRDYHARTTAIAGLYRGWLRDESDPVVVTEMRPFEEMIELRSIASPEKRGRGAASRVLGEITDLADRHDVTMHLYAKPFPTRYTDKKLTRAQLVAWYGRHGFHRFSGGGMTRPPRKKGTRP